MSVGKLARLLIVSLTIGFIPFPLRAADDAIEPTRDQLLIQLDIMKDQLAKLARENADLRNTQVNLGGDVYRAWVQLKKREYSYYEQLMDSNVRTFHAQQIASYVVLFLVVIVVSAGIVFSGFQLWKSVTTGVQQDTNLEVSASSVRVTSSVVGIVVLAISLAFLFIYAHEVYHIKELGTTGSEHSPAPK